MVEGSYYCTLSSRRTAHMHEGVVELYWQDDQLKGSMISTFYWRPSNFQGGRIDGDQFEFDAFWCTPAQQYHMHVTGRVEGDDITGIADTMLGQYELKGYRVQDSYRRGGPIPAPGGGFQRTVNQRLRRE